MSNISAFLYLLSELGNESDRIIRRETPYRSFAAMTDTAADRGPHTITSSITDSLCGSRGASVDYTDPLAASGLDS